MAGLAMEATAITRIAATVISWHSRSIAVLNAGRPPSMTTSPITGGVRECRFDRAGQPPAFTTGGSGERKPADGSQLLAPPCHR